MLRFHGRTRQTPTTRHYQPSVTGTQLYRRRAATTHSLLPYSCQYYTTLRYQQRSPFLTAALTGPRARKAEHSSPRTSATPSLTLSAEARRRSLLTSDTATFATTLGEARPALATATATATTTRVSRPRLLHNLPRQPQQHYRQQQQQQRMQTMMMTKMFGLRLLLLLLLLHNGNK